MASRFCHPFLFSVLCVVLVLTSGGGAIAEPVTGMIDEDLLCFGLCTENCKKDCASKGFKSSFCIEQGTVDKCCCL
ncbi:hypothetical protein PHAVU_008G121400 [Phaseolus vulgaris]|uniref:Knottin scorpion toxin-like domain-containing protein n=1 Tax=Phaseolus vulgaris TaxID=3885 RepID=V7B3Y1_PHAVU|nr:hypothetical protein PHAVU_008G121400g [Phaseolus vulgaris]ESW12539.1 hypothetical protein PHAVU_008G121400g [Phaseolus vulgaris]